MKLDELFDLTLILIWTVKKAVVEFVEALVTVWSTFVFPEGSTEI